jgi:hypothetical protein
VKSVLGCVLLVALCAGPANSRAGVESPVPLEDGARVRVTLLARHSEPVVGLLLAIRPEALEVRPDSVTRTIPRVDIRKLEVSRGMKSGSGKGAKIGGIVGGVGGLAFGALLSYVAINENEDDAVPVLVVGAGVAGCLGGTLLGALIGAPFRSERWRRTELPAAAP